MEKNTRPPIESLACPYEDCQSYGKAALGNLRVRKLYGKDCLRYLRCTSCSREFSERKNTPLWNSKVPEAKAISVAEHLADGCSTKATARLVGVGKEVVQRLRSKLGEHGQGFHEERVREVEASCVEMDERYGYVASKEQPLWEAIAIDPKSKLVLALVLGQRNEALAGELMEDTCKRLAHPHDFVLMTDGLKSYKSLFPQVFGIPYRPPRKGSKGRLPKLRYRIPRTLAHVQVVKERQGSRVISVETRLAHGSWKRVQQELDQLGYTTPNLSAVERQNGTSRRMNAYLVRKSLAFARQEPSRTALGWWGTTVQNWCRVQRGLRVLLPQPQGRKQYQQRTPAMAAGLTHRIWTVADVLRCPIYPRRG
jgi:IS1 family transposase/transposase-like protein